MESLGIAAGALRVFQTMAETSARNVANQATPGYKRLVAQPVSKEGGGVQVEVRRGEGPVELARELADQAIAAHGMEAASSVFRAADQQIGTLLDTFA